MDTVEALRNLVSFAFDIHRVCHLIAAFCLVNLVLKVTKLFISRKQSIKALEAFPGPPRHWLYGHEHEFHQDGTDFDKYISWAKQYPYCVPFWFGPFVSVLDINHPDYVKTILATTEPKDDISYTFLIPWIGNGLLVADGQKWFRHRRLLTPGFHYDVLKPYVKLVADASNIMLDKWEKLAGKEESMEVYQHISLMTLDSIMKCAFSYHSNCQIERSSPCLNSYIGAVYELCDLTNTRFWYFPYHIDIIFHLSPHGYRFRKACKVARGHTEQVIKQRKETLQDEKELLKIQKKRYLDFLDILLCARDEHDKGLSDEDIRAEVDTFMFEGHDTTASGISWILYNLAANPEHQQKCRDEVQAVLAGKDTMDWEDLSKIPYTTMCIKESLRLSPPVPGISRKLTKPLTFCDGKTLPEGSLVGINIYCIHRCPSIWENPEVFDPLRFSSENSAKRHPYAFIPFSAGPRNCIGQTFAMNEMKVAVAMILNRFELAADPSRIPKKISKLVLKSLNGIHLKIKKIE
ncbi:cytochrome P450 4B1-like [Polyodon spathula]|uniref:cytochrome P450 4B1-like n=1 Tax=Polyodon spathula TaxID=7913 RepID=UPI001B7DA402|nr:cytochrome P450 4B1-like [Polyodon spathula]